MSAASKKRRYVRNPKYLTAGEAAALAEMSENAIRWNLRKGYLRTMAIVGGLNRTN